MTDRRRQRHWLWIFLFLFSFLAALAVLAWGGRVLAGPPGLASTVWGRLTLDGVLAVDGMPVQALVRGSSAVTTTVVSSAEDGGGLYMAIVEGGIDGDPVTFAVSGYEIGPTATWISGTVQELDLHNGPFTYTYTANVSGSVDVTFPARDGGPGLVVNANGLGLGATTVRVRANQECINAPGQAVRRCFEIAPANSSGLSATLTFYYYSSQIPDGSTCADMNAYRWTGSTWQPLTTIAHDCSPGRHSLQVSGVTDFSHFVLAEELPTAVTLRAFSVRQARPAGVAVGLLVLVGGVALLVLRRRRVFVGRK